MPKTTSKTATLFTIYSDVHKLIELGAKIGRDVVSVLKPEPEKVGK